MRVDAPVTTVNAHRSYVVIIKCPHSADVFVVITRMQALLVLSVIDLLSHASFTKYKLAIIQHLSQVLRHTHSSTHTHAHFVEKLKN